jgi:hypothetical protein
LQSDPKQWQLDTAKNPSRTPIKNFFLLSFADIKEGKKKVIDEIAV